MVINRRLILATLISGVALCSGGDPNQNSSRFTPPAEIDASSIKNSIQIKSNNGLTESWWKIALRSLTNRPSKRNLNKNTNQIDTPHFQPNHQTLAFGDYVDPTFNCPATITCPLICVADVSQCPDDATCALASDHPDHEFELCKNGHCADLTVGESCDPSAVSECTCPGLEVTCPKQVDLDYRCEERFGEYHMAYHECVQDQNEELYELEIKPVRSKLLYIPIILVTGFMLLWCAYNQRFRPVERSSTILESEQRGEVGEITEEGEEAWIQTGYKRNVVGMALYVFVILLHLQFQVLLLYFTIEYYIQAIHNPEDSQNEVTILLGFELTWMVGLVWCFIMKYPESIHSLFLRRCLPNEGTFIAVTAPVKRIDTIYEKTCITRCFEGVRKNFCRVMNFIFSLESGTSESGLEYKTTFCEVISDERTATRYFYFRMRRYVYDDRLKRYRPGCMDITKDTTIGMWLNKSTMHKGLSMSESTWRLGIVGPNILHMEKPTLLKSIIKEFSQAFYLYQNYMVWSWVPQFYWYMALTQTVVRLSGGIIVAVFKYMSDLDLYRLTITEGTAVVVRDGAVVTIDKTDVVPGDIVRLAPGYANFDMAILKSNHLVVDEAALTGEVNPIAKIPLDPLNPDQVYDPTTNKSSTIFAGTSILECGDGDGIEGDLAIVTQTGSFTSKGELLSDVLSNERHLYKFHREAKLVLFILLVEAIVLAAVTLSIIEGHWVYAWFYAVYVAATVLPPLLPTVFVVSVGISCRRLQDKRVTCTDPTGVLAAGKVSKAFFDKTGTLTEQGLQFVSAQKCDGVAVTRSGESSMEPLLQLGLSVCHTLTLSENGELVGPTVDREAFEAVPSAKFLENGEISLGGLAIKVLKRFDFDYNSRTQSVIVEYGDAKYIFVKGSPESICKLCEHSSLPDDYEAKMKNAARNGFYQLAIARSIYKGDQSINEVQSSDIEKDLIFTGCVNYQNSMKQEAPHVISQLKQGNISPVIVTGDNVLTGIYIAKRSGIIPPKKNVVVGMKIYDDDKIEWTDAMDGSPAANPLLAISDNTVLAMTGEVWNHLLQTNPESAIELGKHTCVFGRCDPNDKISVVSAFVERGDITLMCGDGGNDCGALKAAHVGLALSNAEASVVAPFTSVDNRVTSVIEILREGRCGLASTLASYKYMIMYGQVETINQGVGFSWMASSSNSRMKTDSGIAHCVASLALGFWSISMAFSLPLSKAAKKLSSQRPTASILGPHTLSSACGVLAINFLFLVIALVVLHHQDWYQCRQWNGDDISLNYGLGDNYEASTIFIVTGYQYISSAAAYNFGYTFRECWYKNYVFLFFFSLWTAFQFSATLTASSWSCIWRLNCDNDHVVSSVTGGIQPINNPWNTTVMPMSYRWILVGLMIANLILVCVWEYFVVNRSWSKSNAANTDDLGVETKHLDSEAPELA